MKGYIIVNRYYSDAGVEHACKRLIEEAEKKDIELEVVSNFSLSYDRKGSLAINGLSECDFFIFWDKDTKLARALEKLNYKVFNSSLAIDICNDKESTYFALASNNIPMPKTISAPLVYPVNEDADKEFLALLEVKLGLPMVVKENIGSLGQQVYLASTKDELKKLNKKLLHVPHHYQELILTSCGIDVRVYVIGGKSVAACNRESTVDFRANISQGGTIEMNKISEDYILMAEKVAKILNIDYCAVDFLIGLDAPILMEVNSNAYFKAIEEASNVNIASSYINHIIRELKNAQD